MLKFKFDELNATIVARYGKVRAGAIAHSEDFLRFCNEEIDIDSITEGDVVEFLQREAYWRYEVADAYAAFALRDELRYLLDRLNTIIVSLDAAERLHQLMADQDTHARAGRSTAAQAADVLLRRAITMYGNGDFAAGIRRLDEV